MQLSLHVRLSDGQNAKSFTGSLRWKEAVNEINLCFMLRIKKDNSTFGDYNTTSRNSDGVAWWYSWLRDQRCSRFETRFHVRTAVYGDLVHVKSDVKVNNFQLVK
ncbi:hypothetical protein AVEN_149266-1 [Araneus ventricosus]|uniref:Uncharacterized protein n=1 Tax=Araneus ventricosus TaxID=182803 RepID=A0A4Y2QKN9_ARAVE|nr:hypothetical protein AVEN_1038-1 [Araneus ventricosus]GBN63825.1 hypothetical protein AVEN_27684-1 [Araneus ventricosus]GBN63844.1 hypothetical protein AVEN_84305-1 [Araneus ventricosus]GBN63872.1 hypothetical protein AVEN_149266-1 [Araneus ventricosus]